MSTIKKTGISGTKFEGWAAVSNLRIFGLPFVLAIAISVIAGVAGHTFEVLQVAGNLFMFFLVFAVIHAVANKKTVRLGVQMSFMLVFFVMVLQVPFMIGRLPQVRQQRNLSVLQRSNSIN